MIDASASVVDTLNADPPIKNAYRERTGWDPGEEGGDWVYIRLRPQMVEVWLEVDEIIGGPSCETGLGSPNGSALLKRQGHAKNRVASRRLWTSITCSARNASTRPTQGIQRRGELSVKSET